MLAGRLNWQQEPFDHCVIDGFFPGDLAKKLEDQFPPYHDPAWYCYNNAIEKKKTLNLWHMFPRETYETFHALCSETIQGSVADYGLHGGGWHIHGNGGNLNPHQDYQKHPLLGLHRKFNLIVFLSSDFKVEYGGALGLWDGDDVEPKRLIKSIEPVFNRAVIFDTTNNSWHGLVSPIECPENVYRKSIAVYYLNEGSGERTKALFAPRDEQKGDKDVENLIRRRLGGAYK